MRIDKIYIATPFIKLALDSHVSEFHGDKAQTSNRCINCEQKCNSHDERRKNVAMRYGEQAFSREVNAM